MNLSSAAMLCFSFGTLLTAFFVLIKRHDKVAFHFLFFSLSVFAWGSLWSYWTMNVWLEYETLLFLSRLGHAFACFIPSTWFLLCGSMTGQQEKMKWISTAFFVVSLLLSIFSLSQYLVNGLQPLQSIENFPVPGPLYGIFMSFLIMVILLGFLLLCQKYRIAINFEKKQLKLFMVATCLGFIPGILSALPVYSISISFSLIGLMVLYPFLMAVALIKYRFFDFNFWISMLQKEKLTMMGLISASINHEIKKPLYVLRGLMETNFNREGGDCKLMEIERKEKCLLQIDRLSEIVRRFSSFTKASAVEEQKKEKVLLEEVIDNVLFLVGPELKLQNIKINLQIEKGIVLQVVRTDLEEIILNLCVNACYAMKNREMRTLELMSITQDNEIEIAVSDNGVGIKEENLSRIFDPLYSTKEEGTGLGLFITKMLVEKNEGTLDVSSQVNEGTVFKLIFKC